LTTIVVVQSAKCSLNKRPSWRGARLDGTQAAFQIERECGEAVLAALRAIGLLDGHGCCTFYEKSHLGARFFATTCRRF
jgi:hypothetical protein